MSPVNNPLSGGKKTEVTSVETALNTAIAGLSANDTSQAAALSTLRKMRKMLENLKVERAN